MYISTGFLISVVALFYFVPLFWKMVYGVSDALQESAAARRLAAEFQAAHKLSVENFLKTQPTPVVVVVPPPPPSFACSYCGFFANESGADWAKIQRTQQCPSCRALAAPLSRS